MTAQPPGLVSGLTPAQAARQAVFAAFIDDAVVPHADRFDREERLPPELLRRMADDGLLGVFAPAEFGGTGDDMVVQGLLCEEVGRGSGSLLSLFTVHGMACAVLARWGTAEQKANWLPRLARGEVLGAFALTEPEIGSDARNITSHARRDGDGWRLSGRKKWISCAQIADVILVVAQTDEGAATFLVETSLPGVEIKPISGLLGFRSAMLGEVILDDVALPAGALVGRPGFGFSHIAGTALDHGRFCIAWGCVGLAQACLDASLSYAATREQFGQAIAGHQLIQGMLADMITDTKAARALCVAAADRRAARDPGAIMDIAIAKYYAGRTAMRVASDAVQIHGANGCSEDYPVQRHFRDAKIMEIIEGSNQIQQMIIARHGSARQSVKTGAPA